MKNSRKDHPKANRLDGAEISKRLEALNGANKRCDKMEQMGDDLLVADG